jgi:hypothetical protein
MLEEIPIFRRLNFEEQAPMICGTSARAVRTGRLTIMLPGSVYAVCNECIVEYERGFLASLRKMATAIRRPFFVTTI